MHDPRHPPALAPASRARRAASYAQFWVGSAPEGGLMRRFAAVRPKEDRESVASARARLAQLLAMCTDPALEAMTARGLAGTHRVPLKECEYALTIERQRRAARGY
jgi:hypothetical protein